MFWSKNKIQKKKETIASMFQTTVINCEADCLEIIEKQKDIIREEKGIKDVDYDIKDIKVTYLDRSEATRTYNLFIILTVEYSF